MEIKVTKKAKLLSIRNSMASCDYWLINARLFNAEKTGYYRVKFILWVDFEDVYESETDYKDYLDEMIFAFCDSESMQEFNPENLQAFIDKCNKTIDWFNGK